MKKVLSFVLVLALVLSSFSMAFAADTTAKAAGLSDIKGTANEQAIEVCNNLGIVTGNPDGTFLPEKAVNRAEFAAMITRALGIPESALAGYTTSKFKDTTGYGWAVPYLAFCESKGIMLGDGAGNAMPGRQINTNEAVTMILRAVGYTANSAELVGVWPANYVSLAQDKGIYDSTAKTINVDKANAAQMIYNGLTVQKVQVNADGQTTALTKQVSGNNIPLSMLNTGLNCYIGANKDYQPEVVSYSEDAVINVMPYLGDYAYVYYNSDDQVVAVGDVESKAITGKFTDGTTFEGDDDVTYSVNANATKAAFVNGELKTSFTPTTNNTDTYTINVKVNNKTVKNAEFYSIESWVVSDHAQITADEIADIKDAKLLGNDFATNKNDEIIAKTFDLVGVKTLDEIKADSVVYVYEDAASKEIRKVEVGTTVVEGEVTKVSADGAKATINGNVYKYSSVGTTERMDAGDTVKVYLDAAGKVYDYDKTSGSADAYGVIIQVGGATGSYGSLTGEVRMIVGDGTTKSYEVDSDLVSKGATTADWSVIGFDKTGTKTTNAAVTGDIVKYSLDKDGTIDDLKYVSGQTRMGSTTTKFTNSNFYGKFAVNADALVFAVDTADFNDKTHTDWADKANYSITTLANLKDKTFDAYYALDKYGKIDVMIVDSSAAGSNDIYGVITDKGSVTKDGDRVYQFTTLVKGQETVYDVKKSIYDTIDLGDDADMAVLYKFDFNASNEIDALTPFTSAVGVVGSPNQGTTGAAVSSANAISISGNVVTVSGSGINGSDKVTVTGDATVYVYNAVDQVFEAKRLNNVKSAVSEIAGGGTRNLMFFVSDDADGNRVPDTVVLFK